MNEQGLGVFSDRQLNRVIELCEEYVRTQPQHLYGFCHWAYKEEERNYAAGTAVEAAPVYDLVSSARMHWNNGPGFGGPMYENTLYVSRWPSYNEERAAFVALLRDNLRSYLGQRDATER